MGHSGLDGHTTHRSMARGKHSRGCCVFLLLNEIPIMLLQVSTNVSDLHELIGGLPRVWVAVPEAPDSTINEDKLNGSDKVPFIPCFAHTTDAQRCRSQCESFASSRLWWSSGRIASGLTSPSQVPVKDS